MERSLSIVDDLIGAIVGRPGISSVCIYLFGHLVHSLNCTFDIIETGGVMFGRNDMSQSVAEIRPEISLE